VIGLRAQGLVFGVGTHLFASVGIGLTLAVEVVGESRGLFPQEQKACNCRLVVAMAGLEKQSPDEEVLLQGGQIEALVGDAIRCGHEVACEMCVKVIPTGIGVLLLEIGGGLNGEEAGLFFGR